jgi:hypothetical protein
MLAASVAGCASGRSSERPPQVGGPPGSADRFLVVDCLLPAQIRKLGRSVTYLGPRRAVKTTAADCEIRGGEYVSYDRADYGTALRVWLPLAQDGDVVAQTYVGEVFEKGLGIAPDYRLAAAWYEKAAAKGHTRAQINLGHLYERGLGVDRNPVMALDWYRRASGMTEAIALDTSNVDGQTPGELAKLREESTRRRQEAEALQRQLEAAREDLVTARRNLVQRSAEAESERQRVEQARQELERARLEAQTTGRDTRAATEAQVGQLEAELERRLTELAQQRQQLAGWRDRVARLEADAERRRREETGALAAQLEEVRGQLDDTRGELARRILDADAERRRVEDARAELEHARQEALAGSSEQQAGMQAQVRTLEAELHAREAELEQRRRELGQWREQVTRLEREVSHKGALPLAPEQLLALAGPSIQMIEPAVVATRGVSVVAVPAGSLAERVVVGQVTAPAGLVALIVNDREETVDANGLFRARVPVPAGGGLIKVVAVDRQGKRGDLEFRLAPGEADGKARVGPNLPADIKLGTYHALVIGNVAYRHWPSLKTAEVDARKTAELLRQRYGFKTRLLINATRYDVLQALNELRNELTEEDNLLIYYAGHGYLDEKINRAYWIPVDGALDSNADWITTVAITDLVGAISAKHVLIVADSCYAGALTRSALARLEAGMTDEARRHWLQVVASKRSRTVLTSGDVKPVLDIGGGAHSVFGRAWLDVLSRNDDVLEGQRLYREIAARVAYAADALKFEQVPQYAPIRYAGHEAGDFLFVPSAVAR